MVIQKKKRLKVAKDEESQLFVEVNPHLYLPRCKPVSRGFPDVLEHNTGRLGKCHGNEYFTPLGFQVFTFLSKCSPLKVYNRNYHSLALK